MLAENDPWHNCIYSINWRIKLMILILTLQVQLDQLHHPHPRGKWWQYCYQVFTPENNNLWMILRNSQWPCTHSHNKGIYIISKRNSFPLVEQLVQYGGGSDYVQGDHPNHGQLLLWNTQLEIKTCSTTPSLALLLTASPIKILCIAAAFCPIF